jgi:hypothetical protein
MANPWRALRARPHILFRRAALPDGVDGWISPGADGEPTVILVSDQLGYAERRAVLAHELVHDERGGGAGYAGQPPTWDAVVARDERAVDRAVAQWLVPADELAEFVRSHHPEPVTAEMVSAWFDVPLWVVEWCA